jgi:mono/diheme cytochrome c family protein
MQRKKIFWIVLLIILTLMLAACAGDEAETPAEQPAAEEEVIEEPAEEEEVVEEPAEEEEAVVEEEEPAAEEEAPTEELAGQDLYNQNCAGCHGSDRNGGRGPALLPDTLTEEASVYVDIITNGSGGMPSFEGELSTEEIEALVAFILSEPE